MNPEDDCHLKSDAITGKETPCEGYLVRRGSIYGAQVLGCMRHWENFDKKLWPKLVGYLKKDEPEK